MSEPTQVTWTITGVPKKAQSKIPGIVLSTDRGLSGMRRGHEVPDTFCVTFCGPDTPGRRYGLMQGAQAALREKLLAPEAVVAQAE